MLHPKTILRRIQRPTHRRASVLILVVALLVLMAMIATALIGNVRSDRYTAVQNTNNTQVDLLLEGVKNMTIARIVDDLYDKNAAAGAITYRAETGTGTYAPFDGPEVNVPNTNGTFAAANDQWLASRSPDVKNGTAAGTYAVGTNPISWGAITNPIIGSTFESPAPVAAAGGITQYQIRAHVQPTVTTINGVVVPALTRIDALSGTSGWSTTAAPFPAADADGDGIADAGLVKLPIGEINGLTYYVGVRIIDNAAAINLNTAFSRAFDFDFNGAVTATPTSDPAGLFRSHVGLAEFLRTWTNATAPQAAQATYSAAASIGTEMDAINIYRLTGKVPAAYPNAPVPAQLPAGIDGDKAAIHPVPTPLGDHNAAANLPYSRLDYVYVTLGGALDDQLARRVDNPGFGYDYTQRLRGFSVADQLSIAYRFTGTNTDASLSQLEDMMVKAAAASTPVSKSSLLNIAGNNNKKSYGLTDADVYNWFEDHFDYSWEKTGGDTAVAADPTTFRSRRTQLTLLSRTSNFASPRTAAGSNFAVPITGMRPYAPYVLGAANPTHVPGQQAVATRTSINTASFNELWRAFYSVMAEPDGSSPYGIDPVTAYATAGYTAYPGALSNALTNPPPYNDPRSLPGNGASTKDHDYRLLYTGSTFPQPPVSLAAGGGQDGSFFSQDRYTSPNPQHVQRMFRSCLRDNRAATVTDAPNAFRYTPDAMIALRSAMAANNADWMRRPQQRDPDPVAGGDKTLSRPQDTTNTPQPIQVLAKTSSAAAGTLSTYVDVFAVGPQPFITEVYASGDTSNVAGKQNPNGYLAIELYNPYPKDIVLDDTYKLVILDRKPATAFDPAGGTGRTVRVVYSFDGTLTIPGGGGSNSYVTIDSFDDSVATAYRPASLSPALPATGALLPTSSPPGVSIPALLNNTDVNYRAFDSEIQLVRVENKAAAAGSAQAVQGPATSGATPTDIGAYVDMIQPLDSYDLTGFNATSANPPVSATKPQVWHYVRASNTSNGQAFFGRWTCVYPGRYDGSLTERRQQGTEAFSYDVTAGESDSTIVWPSGLEPDFSTGGNLSSYQTRHVIPLLNLDTGDLNPIVAGTAAAPNRFPYGGFARNGDILQVPFIAGYRVRDAATNQTLELNSVSMDSAFAEDTDPDDDPQDPTGSGTEPSEQQNWRESVGRFMPIIAGEEAGSGEFTIDSKPGPLLTWPNKYMYRDDISQTLGPTQEWVWRYKWSSDLFEYLTVQNPHDDYMPNAFPTIYDSLNAALPVEPTQNSYGPPATEKVYGSTLTPPINRGIEDQVPIDGLINLNTASWRVLATLPWMQEGLNRNQQLFSGSTLTDNELIAKAIVQFRDGVQLLPGGTTGPFKDFPVGDSPDDLSPGPPGGPFRSIYDIYRVKGVRLLSGQAFARSAAFGIPANKDAGDLTFPDDTNYDFEERTLLLNRVSNLVTVRSDAFTAYIVLEGWKNAGTATAQRVVQRRAAFLIDRSGVTPTNPKVKTINIPTE